MAEPFASVTDLESGWRTLSTAEKTRATTLLARASRKIRAQKPSIDALIAAETIDADLVGDVCCAMVKRVMQGPADLDGVSQHQQTTGPFQQGVTFVNPSGDMFLTKAERRDLRITAQRAASIDLIPDEDDDES